MPLWMWVFFALSVAILVLALTPYTRTLSMGEKLQQTSRQLAIALSMQLGLQALLLGWLLLVLTRALTGALDENNKTYFEKGDTTYSSISAVVLPLTMLNGAMFLSIPIVQRCHSNFVVSLCDNRRHCLLQ